MQIIVAWTEVGVVAARARRADLGELPVLTMGPIAHTVLWLNDGAADDVAKAEQWAAKQGPTHRVFTYGPKVKDARAEAAKAILAGK